MGDRHPLARKSWRAPWRYRERPRGRARLEVNLPNLAGFEHRLLAVIGVNLELLAFASDAGSEAGLAGEPNRDAR